MYWQRLVIFVHGWYGSLRKWRIVNVHCTPLYTPCHPLKPPSPLPLTLSLGGRGTMKALSKKWPSHDPGFLVGRDKRCWFEIGQIGNVVTMQNFLYITRSIYAIHTGFFIWTVQIFFLEPDFHIFLPPMTQCWQQVLNEIFFSLRNLKVLWFAVLNSFSRALHAFVPQPNKRLEPPEFLRPRLELYRDQYPIWWQILLSGQSKFSSQWPSLAVFSVAQI